MEQTKSISVSGGSAASEIKERGVTTATQQIQEACSGLIRNEVSKEHQRQARDILAASIFDVSQDARKARCSADSIVRAFGRAITLRLMPGGLNQIAFVPFRSKSGASELTAIVGYQGLITLITRDRSDISIHTDSIRENDEFQIESGSTPHIVHRPLMTGVRGKAIVYYAVGRVGDSAPTIVYMSRAEVEAHARAFARSENIWREHFDRMALKTCVIRLAKLLPLGDSVRQAIDGDSVPPEGATGIVAPPAEAEIETKDDRADSPKPQTVEDNRVTEPSGPSDPDDL